jgi:hypothetical protein
MATLRRLVSAICGLAVLSLAWGCSKETPSQPLPPKSSSIDKAAAPAATPAPAAPAAGPTVVEPAKAEPPKASPAEAEPAKTEPVKAEPAKTEPAPAAAKDTIWFNDDLPEGANAQQDGDDAWTWVEADPAPQSGKKCHQSNVSDGEHQHYFTDATATLEIKAGDKLVAWVFMDKDKTPSEVMLQWHAEGSWEHRAYWGANSIDWGADATESRLSMGALPAAGKWVRLEVPADKVGLEGKTLDGMAFSLFGGKASWDSAGKAPATK